MAENAVIKVIVIGDSLVGKTSFIQRYVNQSYRPEYKTTIGGQERFTYMTRAYYKDAKACILMFDLTNEHSFVKVTKWKQDLDSKARMPDGSHLPCLLVANKVDLTKRQVSHEQVAKVCEDLDFAGWTETSAKEGIMVNESIKYLLDVVTGNVRRKLYHRTEITDSVKVGPKRSDELQEVRKCSC